MGIDTISAVAAVLLAISLATERLVAIAKTLHPWLADRPRTSDDEFHPETDRWRRMAVQGLAFVCAWITSAFLADEPSTGFPAGLLGTMSLAGIALPTLVVALLASGGSAFWASVVGYTSAVKDVRRREAARLADDNERARRLKVREEKPVPV